MMSVTFLYDSKQCTHVIICIKLVNVLVSTSSLVVEHLLCVWEVQVRFSSESHQRFQVGSCQTKYMYLELIVVHLAPLSNVQHFPKIIWPVIEETCLTCILYQY